MNEKVKDFRDLRDLTNFRDALKASYIRFQLWRCMSLVSLLCCFAFVIGIWWSDSLLAVTGAFVMCNLLLVMVKRVFDLLHAEVKGLRLHPGMRFMKGEDDLPV